MDGVEGGFLNEQNVNFSVVTHGGGKVGFKIDPSKCMHGVTHSSRDRLTELVT